MSKKKAGRKSAGQKQKQIERPLDAGRRRFLWIGGGALAAAGLGIAGAYQAGWLSSEETATEASPNGDYQTAMRAANEMLEKYSREIGNASVLIHAVRGLGRDFPLADGSKAADHLCSRYAADKEVAGRRYVYFLRSSEVHENSFLKTFLEAGVSLDQPVVAGGNRYTLRDVAESGKALFRCDPADLYKFDENQFRYDTTFNQPRVNAAGQTVDLRGELVHEHLPWGLIAFSVLTKPDQAVWTNAYGETIDLNAVIDRSLADYERTCALGQQALMSGESAPKNFRDEIKKYSCFGIHSVYGFLACLKNGYRDHNLPDRARQMMELLTYRLKGDTEAIDDEYAAASQGQNVSSQLIEAFKLRARIKLLGHSFEAINYAKLNKLTTFTPSQERRIQSGEQALYDSLVRMRAMDWGMMSKMLGEKFVSDVVIALGHAARAMKLLTPQNPDVIV